MSPRPLVFVAGLTLADYALWKWSLAGHHDALSLVSGLTLPPLGAACAWLIALAVMRALAYQTRLPARRRARRASRGATTANARRSRGAHATAAAAGEGTAQSSSSGSSSGRLAA